MLDWILKYKVRVPGAPAKAPAKAPATGAAEQSAATAARPANPGGDRAKANTPAKKVAAPVPSVDWAARLQAALGNDTDLLSLAKDASPLQTKLDAVAALSSEEALKAAEREFRSNNRRVHSLAKQRLQAQRAQREARAEAARLIEAAQALAGEALIPVNSAVELDRAWQTLDSALLEPGQRERFAALTAQLSGLTRQRADLEAGLKRWRADSLQAQQQLQAACTHAASGEQETTVLTQAVANARAAASAAPAGVEAPVLHQLIATAEALQERLALLQRVLAGGPAPQAQPAGEPVALVEGCAAATESSGNNAADAAAVEAGAAPAAEAAGAAPAEDATTEAATPAASPIAPDAVAQAPAPDASPLAQVTAPDTAAAAEAPPAASLEAAPGTVETPAEASSAPGTPADATAPARPPRPPRPPSPAQQWLALPPLADSRLAALLQARFEAWQHEQEEARQQQKAQRREKVQEHKQALRTERVGALEAALTRAEARLAEGQVAQTHQHLIEIDDLLHGGAPAEALRARIDRLQAGYAELRGWQHWAGGRARDDLTAEAEALAASCAPGPEGQLPKLQLKAHADRIENLHQRWKELDRLGGASSRALWQRFDAAMKAAFEPVAAARAAQSAVREQNLAARRALLDTLESVPLPAAGEANTEVGSAPDLRPAISALDHFRVEWRKLGPVEHTVPRKAQDRLVQRMDAAVQRLHEPIDAARQGAQLARQDLIERAKALAAFAQAQAQNGPPPERGGYGAARAGVRDMVGEVRALQGQWQLSAQSLPLPRQLENALWQQFKSALDAVFSAREAAFSARDAEFKAHADERQALIERVEALVEALQAGGEASAHDTKRTLAEVDAQWQRCGPAPRAQAGALEDRFRRAREAAQQWLAGSRQRSWNATCDALDAKLALCVAREQGAAADALAPDWAALPALPAAWETALQQRAGLATAAPEPHKPARLGAEAVLLQLEAAWNLPSPPAFAAARRELQLQAMKAALETRRSAAATAQALSPDQWLALALRQPTGADQTLQERLATVLAALRRRGPAAG